MKRQKSPWSCGAAVVRNALRVFKCRVSENEIRGIAGTTKQFGTSEKGILSAIRAYGFKAVEHHIDDKEEAWEWLHETLVEGKPVILCVENWEHWVVAIGSCGNTGIAVFDSSNFKVNLYENNTHVWDKKHLFHKWWNNRLSVDDEVESRLYAIAVSK